MKARRLLALAMALLLLASMLVLASCGKEPATKTLDNLSSYVIIYPTDVDIEIYRALLALKDDIKAETGLELLDEEDFVSFDEEVPTDTLEILIGGTNRSESFSQKLGYDDTGIYFENNRLVISGGSTESIVKAINLFAETYVKDGAVSYPTSPDLCRGTYPYANVTLDGVSIYDYVIVRDVQDSALASILQERISKATGAVLPILKPSDDVTAHEIIIGSGKNFTGERAVTAAPANKWKAEMKNGRLFLNGSGEDGDYAAVYSLIEKMAGSGSSLSITYPTAVIQNVEDMAFYTLNLPTTLGSMAGKYDISYSTQTVLDRFFAARDELPTEVTVVDRVAIEEYPLSLSRTVYVSPNGDDTAAGTKEAPLATLDAALLKMQDGAGGTIFMMGGTYTVTETVTLTGRHSGLRQAPLFIKAYNDEKVTISSNRSLDTSADKWHFLDENDPLYDRIPSDSRAYLMVTTLEAQGWHESDVPAITTSGAPNLYVGGEEYVVARFPNETIDNNELLYFTHAYDTGTVTTRDGSDLYFTWVERASKAGWDPVKTIVGWEIRVLNLKDNEKDKNSHYEYGDEILSWVNTGDIWYYGSTFEGWEFGYYNLALETEGRYWAHNENGEAYDPNRDEVAYLGYPKDNGYYSLKSMTHNSWGCKVSGNSSAGRNTFYLFNAIEALDAPGEWFYDKETGNIYLFPEENHFNLDKAGVSIGNPAAFNLMSATSTNYLVLDGLTFDGSSKYALYLNNCRSVIVQDCTFKNTKNCNLSMTGCRDTAIIYSDFSAAYNTMLNIQNSSETLSLTPTNNVVQNCIFHDPMPLKQTAISWGGCRLVVSHNYFNNTTTSGSGGVECIIEYNRFEGGSKDVTDGGFIYASGASSRQNHYRYNLFHMFNATHNAIYNDTMGSGNYSYYNVISTLHSSADHNKAWYSSTGWGNVHYGNINILRNPAQVLSANSSASMESDNNVFTKQTDGDMLNESALFYYYFGDEHAATTNRSWKPVDYEGNSQGSALSQSLAGHWWVGMKQGDVTRYLKSANRAAWTDRAPEYINMMQGTQMILEVWDAAKNDPANVDYHIKHFYVPWYPTGKTYTFKTLDYVNSEGKTGEGTVSPDTVITIPSYRYLNDKGLIVTVEDETFRVGNVAENGEFTLTYEQIASMERARRAPMYSVVMNNIILGGTPIYKAVGSAYQATEAVNRSRIITTSSDTYKGFYNTLLNSNNFMSYLYDDIAPYAEEQFDYTITEEAWALIAAAGAEDSDLSVEEDVLEELIAVSKVWGKTGPTYKLNYGEWFDEVYPGFYD